MDGSHKKFAEALALKPANAERVTTRKGEAKKSIKQYSTICVTFAGRCQESAADFAMHLRSGTRVETKKRCVTGVFLISANDTLWDHHLTLP
jgi:hypothetical protein